MARRLRDSNSERNANFNNESFDSNAFVSFMNRLDPILKAFYSLREEAHDFFEAFHKYIANLISILAASIGSHFQTLGVSPLETHFATFLVLIMAANVYGIACMGIKLQPQGADYLLLFRLICLVSGIIAVELLFSVMISPLWLFVVDFLSILIVGVLFFLYFRADLISGAFRAFSSREREDNDNRRPGHV